MIQEMQYTETEVVIKDKIDFILDLFPKISPSMLQITLGSGFPTLLWKPVLEKMITLKHVYRYQVTSISPSGRNQTVTVLSKDPEPTT